MKFPEEANCMFICNAQGDQKNTNCMFICYARGSAR